MRDLSLAPQVDALSKAQTSQPHNWTMRKHRTVETPYTPRKVTDPDAVEVEIDEQRWVTHMESPYVCGTTEMLLPIDV